ncbi:MAG: PHP domain-containing protein [Clostridia bacterium]|nr:PHP domain-containing protein [Clostridia bacterium]
MGAFCDLHLHSCLSPCAEDDMTPWNMVGMAKIKGLDVIAITDHNAVLNAEDAMAAGREYGVEVIPGMEITSREEVHMLAYFYTLEDAVAAGEKVYAHLPAISNQPMLFGNQIIMRNGDTPSGTLDKLLINATDLSVDEVCELIRAHNGIPLPAHINRGSNGMIGALGLMPFLPEYPVVEVYKGVDCPSYATKGRFLLHSSDAHRLEDIQEQVFELPVEPSAKAVLDLIRTKSES